MILEITTVLIFLYVIVAGIGGPFLNLFEKIKNRI